MAHTSYVLWLREAQSVDVPKHDPHEQISDAHDENDAHAHVQGEHAEVNALEHFTTFLKILSLTYVRHVGLDRQNYYSPNIPPQTAPTYDPVIASYHLLTSH
jgi:hypothetical protein